MLVAVIMLHHYSKKAENLTTNKSLKWPSTEAETFVSKKKTGENNNDLSVASLNNSNSYIHYNSPRYGAGSKHNKRRTSVTSGLTQSTASFGSLMIGSISSAIYWLMFTVYCSLCLTNHQPNTARGQVTQYW